MRKAYIFQYQNTEMQDSAYFLVEPPGRIFIRRSELEAILEQANKDHVDVLLEDASPELIETVKRNFHPDIYVSQVEIAVLRDKV